MNKYLSFLVLMSLFGCSSTIHPVAPQSMYYTCFNNHWHNRFVYPKKPKKVTDTILMSTYLVAGVKEAFLKLNLPDTHYVLCVRYAQNEKGTGGDTQLFVTGGVEAYEFSDPSATALAELAEEAHFRASSVSHTGKFENNHLVSDTYAANMTDLDAIPMPAIRKEEKIVDEKKHKITCIVSGTKAEMKHIVKRIKRVGCEKTNDDIDALVFISVADVKRMIGMIEENKKAKKYDPFWFQLTQ